MSTKPPCLTKTDQRAITRAHKRFIEPSGHIFFGRGDKANIASLLIIIAKLAKRCSEAD